MGGGASGGLSYYFGIACPTIMSKDLEQLRRCICKPRVINAQLLR